MTMSVSYPRMHRLFNCDDLIFIIMTKLAGQGILSFGLTHKSIWSIGMHILWGNVTNVTAVYDLLPTGVLSRVRETDVFTPHRAVGDHGLGRLRFYEPHIRQLSLSDRITDSQEPNVSSRLHYVLSFLAFYSGSTPLLAYLQHLQLDLSSDVSIASAIPVIRRGLPRLSLRIAPSEKGLTPGMLRELLLTMAETAPALARAEILIPGPDDWILSLEAPLLTWIGRLIRLTELNLMVNQDGLVIMPYLACLQTLESLTVETREYTPDEWAMVPVPFLLPIGAFPALKKLQLMSWWSEVQHVSLLQGVASNAMSTIAVRCGHYRTAFAISHVIASKWSHCMRDVEFACSPIGDAPRHGHHIAFMPLISCWALESLSIKVEGDPLEFSDREFDMMSEAWPRLRSLELEDVTGDPDELEEMDIPFPTATRMSLAYFATRCRQLRTLEISVNFDLPEPRNNSLDLVFPNHNLTKFNWAFSTTSNTAETARFLDTIFPSLKEFEHYSGDPDAALVEKILGLNRQRSAETDQDMDG